VTDNPASPSYHNVTSKLKAFQATTGQLSGGHTCANFPPTAMYTDERHNLSRAKSYLVRFIVYWFSIDFHCTFHCTFHWIVVGFRLRPEILYVGSQPETFMWVRALREGTFTLPFTEDYIFQIAAGTQQMYDLVIDLERAAVRPHTSSHGSVTPKQVAAAPLRALPETAAVPGRPIMQFVMVHDPGNTVNSHRRRFYGGLAHGNKWTNLFEYQTFATGAFMHFV